MKTKTIVIIALGILLFFSVSFIVTRMSSPTAIQLVIPKSEATETNNIKLSGSLTMILLSGDKIYYYNGDSVKHGKMIDYAECRTVLLDKKKNTDPKDLVVVIKPSVNSSYKNAVDALDEMAINDIKKYAMVEIGPEEIEFLKLKEEKEPLTVTTPKTVTVSTVPTYALVFFINNDNTIGYKTSADWSKTDQIIINPGNSENIQKVITDTEIEFKSLNKKMEVVIRSDKSGKYPQFKTLIDALKEKEIFKFSMITLP